MHPGPMNRGVEIAGEVADRPNAVITEQVANGVSVRMAVLFLLLGAGLEPVDGPLSAVDWRWRDGFDRDHQRHPGRRRALAALTS